MPYNSAEELIDTLTHMKTDKPCVSTYQETNCPYCAQHLVPNDVHGHISCFACGQIIDACCGGTD